MATSTQTKVGVLREGVPVDEWNKVALAFEEHSLQGKKKSPLWEPKGLARPLSLQCNGRALSCFEIPLSRSIRRNYMSMLDVAIVVFHPDIRQSFSCFDSLLQELAAAKDTDPAALVKELAIVVMALPSKPGAAQVSPKEVRSKIKELGWSGPVTCKEEVGVAAVEKVLAKLVDVQDRKSRHTTSSGRRRPARDRRRSTQHELLARQESSVSLDKCQSQTIQVLTTMSYDALGTEDRSIIATFLKLYPQHLVESFLSDINKKRDKRRRHAKSKSGLAPASLELDMLNVDFEQAPMYRTVRRSIMITNTGKTPVHWVATSNTIPGVKVFFNPPEALLQKHQSIPLQVEAVFTKATSLSEVVIIRCEGSDAWYPLLLHGVGEKMHDFADVSLSDLKGREIVGKGAMGVVYVTEWRGERVAVKEFSCDSIDDQHTLKQFQRDISTMSRLKHPNIVEFKGASTQLPDLFMVMEYAPHGSLDAVLQDKSIPMDNILRVKMALDIAKGMNFLHEMNTLHRDLKSGNLLVKSLEPDDEVCCLIADFDTARNLEEEGFLTSHVGTMFWQAPEVLSGDPPSAESDVYAFGMVMWELIARCEPYADKPFMSIRNDVLAGHRPELPAGHGAPADFVMLMKACWQPDPIKRPNFKQLIAALSTLLQSVYMEASAGPEAANNEALKAFQEAGDLVAKVSKRDFVVLGGTGEALFNVCLTANIWDGRVPTSYTAEWLCSFHLFMTPTQMLDALMSYHQKARITTARLSMLLEQWMGSHFEDLASDREFSRRFTKAVQELEGRGSKFRALKKAQSAELKHQSASNDAVTKHDHCSSSVDDIPIASLVAALTLRQQTLLAQVDIRKLADPRVSLKMKKKLVARSLGRSGLLSKWVCQLVLQASNVVQRTDLLSRFIRISQELYSMQNMMSAMEIITGLHYSPCRALKTAWSNVSSDLRRTYDELSAVLSPEKDYAAYKKELAHLKPPFLPALEPIWRDMELHAETIPTTIDRPEGKKGDPLVNWARIKATVKALMPLLSSRSKAFRFNAAGFKDALALLHVAFQKDSLKTSEMKVLAAQSEEKDRGYMGKMKGKVSLSMGKSTTSHKRTKRHTAKSAFSTVGHGSTSDAPKSDASNLFDLALTPSSPSSSSSSSSGKSRSKTPRGTSSTSSSSSRKSGGKKLKKRSGGDRRPSRRLSVEGNEQADAPRRRRASTDRRQRDS